MLENISNEHTLRGVADIQCQSQSGPHGRCDTASICMSGSSSHGRQSRCKAGARDHAKGVIITPSKGRNYYRWARST